jgi:3-oxoadipate enol-lactonase
MPFANAPGARLYYQRHGKGCPVAFLPGVSNDLRSGSSVFNTNLADKFDILTLDHRGTGRSDKPDVAYSMAQYALDAETVMDAVGWRSAHIIGVSFGGMVAQELAITNPARIRSLVLCCTTSGGAGGSSYPLHLLPDPVTDMRTEKMLGIWDIRLGKAWQADHPESVARMIADALATIPPFLKESGGLTGFKRQLEARSQHDTYQRLPAIQAPTLICGGRYDGHAIPQFLINMQSQIADAEIAFFEGGHNFLNQDPRAYVFIAGAIERYCQGNAD